MGYVYLVLGISLPSFEEAEASVGRASLDKVFRDSSDNQNSNL
jgi:hypothetical protein